MWVFSTAIWSFLIPLFGGAVCVWGLSQTSPEEARLLSCIFIHWKWGLWHMAGARAPTPPTSSLPEWDTESELDVALPWSLGASPPLDTVTYKCALWGPAYIRMLLKVGDLCYMLMGYNRTLWIVFLSGHYSYCLHWHTYGLSLFLLGENMTEHIHP